MPSIAGRTYQLTVVTPIVRGQEGLLRDLLRRLPHGDASPFARAGGVHFARWVVLDDLIHEERGEKSSDLHHHYLLFSAVLDGTPEGFAARLIAEAPDFVQATWGSCVGFPGAEDAKTLHTYLRRHRIESSFFLASTPLASVDDVRASLQLRDRLTAFAIRAQDLDAIDLQTAFRAAFPRGVSAQ